MTIWKLLIIFIVCLMAKWIYWGIVPGFKIYWLYTSYGMVPPNHVIKKAHDISPERFIGIPERHMAYTAYDILAEMLGEENNERRN